MKKTKLVRKTPMKRGGPLKSKTGLKTYAPLKAKSQLKRKTPIKSASILNSDRSVSTAKPKTRNSMRGKGRTSVDIKLHGMLVAAGCIACRLGKEKTVHPLQIHHPEGRNKGKQGDVSERIAMCLCAGHHDQRIYKGYWNGGIFVPVDPSMPSVHHTKKTFIDQYGTELRLVHESYKLIGEQPAWMDESEWADYLRITLRPEQEEFISEFASERKALREVA